VEEALTKTTFAANKQYLYYNILVLLDGHISLIITILSSFSKQLSSTNLYQHKYGITYVYLGTKKVAS
jgi:hypothetical protein